MANNVPFYDAVVAGAGGAIQGWAVDQTPADYAAFANAVAAIATTVDLQIPIIPGGPNAGQVNLLTCITQNVLAGRFPVDATLSLYVNLGKSIAAIYTQVSPKLQGSTAYGGVVPVAQTFFVDAVNYSAAPTGTLGAPYQTIQAAINAAVALGLSFIQLIIAPATYAGAVSIPLGIVVTFHGWDYQAPAILGGDITIAGSIGSAQTFTFTNYAITAANITVTDPATEDISLIFQDSFNSAAIAGFNVIIEYHQSTQAGDVTGNNLTDISYDGYSWSHTLDFAPTILPVGYMRQFYDAGHDVYSRSLIANGVAIGTTEFIDMVVSDYVRADDYVSIQTVDPSIRDFICGIHGVDAGSVVVWITNLSRVTTNFNEIIMLLIHHEAMVAEPAP
jgi:hypothetical protein